MLLDRRLFLTGSMTLLGLTGCMTAPEAALTVRAQGVAGMNPGPDNVDRPVTIKIVQMRAADAFDASDFFALQNPAAALGGDHVQTDEIIVAPGGDASKTIAILPDTVLIGIIAGFRDPAGKQFRAKIPAPGAGAGVIVAVTAGGIKLTTV